ncbi:MAG: carboxypeptidase-like regulatory domain-containing protein [Rikenellaceae bacterium]|jgi:hypothetical protein|nr:carboxypeptidase-like regulatory domain-containing protein [Rikenellaceae bacterium]
MRSVKLTLRTLALAAMIGGAAFAASSCKSDDGAPSVGKGTIAGKVTDVNETPLAGVTVEVSGIEGTTTTGADGTYSVGDVSMERHTVTFSKSGYQTASATLQAARFDNEAKTATLNVALAETGASITGTIYDGQNGLAPLAGATVTLVGASKTATSGADGKWTIADVTPGPYTLSFSKTGYPTLTKEVIGAHFVDGLATVDIQLGGTLYFGNDLDGISLFDLRQCTPWHYSEYRGGKSATSYPHWDWSVDYMGFILSYRGNFQEQNEGSTVQVRNAAAEQANPANLDNFDSFVFGRKAISEDNKVMTLKLRTHNATAAEPVRYSVQVIDLSQTSAAAVKIGGNKTLNSDAYVDEVFDLGAYSGKEVAIAIGIHRAQTGNYYNQLVLRRIAFAPVAVTGDGWIADATSGSTAISGLGGDWKLTKEMVRSTMVNDKSFFTGITPSGSNNDEKFASWRTVDHLATNWAFVPLNKDPEPFPGEGYLIKTRGNGAPDTTVPESYLYAKFAIAAGSNTLTLKTRNFGSNYTFFKLTVIRDDGTAAHIAPGSNTASEASAAGDGCWKFKHGSGGASTPEAYASFVYDLSAYNGDNVVVVIGVYNGELNGDENKLVFHSVELS